MPQQPISVEEWERRYGKVPQPKRAVKTSPPPTLELGPLSVEEWQKRYGAPTIGIQSPTGYEKQPTGLPPLPSFDPVEALPYIGGMIGGAVGNVPGAFLGGGAGKAAQMAIEPPPPPASLSEGLKMIGKEVGLAGAEQAVYQGVGLGITKAIGKVLNPERWYQAALKPKGTPGEQAKIVKTGLREEIVPGAEGRAITEEISKELEAEVAGIIAGGPAKTVRFSDAISGLNRLRTKWSMIPEKQVAIDAMEHKFLRNWGISKFQIPAQKAAALSLNDLRALAANTTLSGPAAQALKKQLYQVIRQMREKAWNPYQRAKPPISVESRLELSEGLMQDLELLYPEIKALNKRDAGLIELRNAIDKFMETEGHRQLISSWALLAGGGFWAMTGDPIKAMTGAIGAQILRSAVTNPQIQARLAIALNKVSGGGLGAFLRTLPANIPRAGGLGIRSLSRPRQAEPPEPPFPLGPTEK